MRLERRDGTKAKRRFVVNETFTRKPARMKLLHRSDNGNGDAAIAPNAPLRKIKLNAVFRNVSEKQFYVKRHRVVKVRRQ